MNKEKVAKQLIFSYNLILTPYTPSHSFTLEKDRMIMIVLHLEK